MYAAGLTVREIAEHCHAPRSTVQRHLQVREGMEPGTRATHEEAYALRPQNGTDELWLKHLQATREFIEATGRQPQTQSHRLEQTLHRWLTQQRKARREGALTPSQVQALDWLGNWKTPPRQKTLDEQWQARLRELVSFVEGTGRLPRYRKYSTNLEHTLGVWLHAQTQRHAEGRLIPWREEQLNQAVAGWHSRE